MDGIRNWNLAGRKTENQPYLRNGRRNGKAYELQSWYTDGIRWAASPTARWAPVQKLWVALQITTCMGGGIMCWSHWRLRSLLFYGFLKLSTANRLSRIVWHTSAQECVCWWLTLFAEKPPFWDRFDVIWQHFRRKWLYKMVQSTLNPRRSRNKVIYWIDKLWSLISKM